MVVGQFKHCGPYMGQLHRNANGSDSVRVKCLCTQNRNPNLKPEPAPNSFLGENSSPKLKPTDTRNPTNNSKPEYSDLHTVQHDLRRTPHPDPRRRACVGAGGQHVFEEQASFPWLPGFPCLVMLLLPLHVVSASCSSPPPSLFFPLLQFLVLLDQSRRDQEGDGLAEGAAWPIKKRLGRGRAGGGCCARPSSRMAAATAITTPRARSAARMCTGQIWGATCGLQRQAWMGWEGWGR